jgi:CRISPR-associated endoribonuclease Cas6
MRKKKSMLLSLVYKLRALNDALLPATLGRAIHACFFNLVKQANAALAERLHHESESQGLARFTTSPLRGPLTAHSGQVQLKHGSEYWLRFTSLDSELSERLLILRAEYVEPFNLLGARLEVIQVASEPSQHPWAAQSDFASLQEHWLVRCPRPPLRIELEFLSPTSFQHGALTLPLPLPRLVFLTLADKWNAFAPLSLGAEINEVIDRVLQLREYELHTRSMRFHDLGKPEVGFVGRCEYGLGAVTAEAECVMRRVHLLGDFAFYAGVGGKTAMGMGQTRCRGRRDFSADKG